LEKVNTALVAQGQNAVFGPGSAGSAGSAVAVINPEDEISVSIHDAAGRSVASGIIAQNGTPITWNLVKYDEVDQATGLVKTSRIDALGHTVSQLADAASRTIQSLDALGKATSMQYDANGNTLSVRDPNNVGWDAGTALGTFNGYDELNRLTARIDTQGDKNQTGYDANGNAKSATDAKNQTAATEFDARDRKVKLTDRIAGVTTWKFDQNSNLLELCDADNQAANKPTVWTYDALNLKVTETYPDHDANAQVGQTHAAHQGSSSRFARPSW
jgi:YD repeat-containing protein